MLGPASQSGVPDSQTLQLEGRGLGGDDMVQLFHLPKIKRGPERDSGCANAPCVDSRSSATNSRLRVQVLVC